MSTTITYKGNTLATVSNNTKTLKTAGKYMEGDVTLTDVSSTIVISETYDANGGIIKEISTTGEVNLQAKTITPTDSIQVINPDTGYDGFSQVTINASSGGIDGNNLKYGYTDGSLPLVGIAKVDSAHVWDDQLQMMIFGTGQIGTGRVV